MKLNEIIREAGKGDFHGCDADSILALARQKHSNPGLFGWKKAVLIAAAVCLFAGTVSASALLLSGFGMAFDTPVDPGHVEVITAPSEESDVVWTFTETWFDKYTLYIGGTVTTPEVLDPAGDHRVDCYYRTPGSERYRLMTGYIFPSGENESAFLISGSTTWSNGSIFEDEPTEELTLELKLCKLLDYTRCPEEGWNANGHTVDDFVTVPGEWLYTVQLESSDDAAIVWNGHAESKDPNIKTTVTSVHVNAFTLEIIGENLNTYKDGDRNHPLSVFLRMKDGTLRIKSRFTLSVPNDPLKGYLRSQSRLCFRSSEPLDLNEVESVLFCSVVCIAPEITEFYFPGEGWEIHPVEEGRFAGRYEGWLPILEIPLT